MPESSFFTEEASRQILLRVASVFNDPDLCDAKFIVGEDDNQEEIPAPSQFMAVSSPYFKDLFYPPKLDDDKRRVIKDMQPQTFRKILDYLFRGKVPLTSIDDAWKVKVAGRTFQLKELEELTTKFLKYRLDSQNLLIYLKNSCKYDCPDLREVIATRFLKDAIVVLDDPAVLDLSEEELLGLIQKRPEVQAKKMVAVLIKWAKKKYNIKGAEDEPFEKKIKLEDGEELKSIENGNSEKKEADVKEDDEKKEEEIKEDNEKKEDDIKEEKETQSLVTYLQPFFQFVRWDHGDAEFFLKEVRNKNIMSLEDENNALLEMLQSYVDLKSVQQQKKPGPVSRGRGPMPASKGRGRQAPEKGPAAGPDLAFVGEKRSRNPGSGGYIIDKIDDDIIIS